MSAFAALVLQNNAAANVTFNPSNITDGVASWYTTASVYDARNRATLSVRLPKNGSNVARVTAKVVLPVMDTIDTTLKVAEGSAEIALVLPKQMSETARLDLRKMIDTFIQNAVMTDAVQKLEAIY